MNKNTNHPEAAPKHIARLLTRAAEQLDDDTVAALRRARSLALQRQMATKPALSLTTGHHMHWPLPHAVPQWAAAVLLVAAIAGGISYWQHSREEMSHLDIAILTDDMPLEVFVDR